MNPSVPARDAAGLLHRVRDLAGDRVSCRTLGEVDGLALLHLEVGTYGAGRPRPLLIAGTHGDEPAGVEAVLEFAADPPAPWLERMCFDVLPCTNPTGFGCGTRETAAGVDLNWSWDRDGVPEIDILRGFLRGRRFPFVLDFHEDWESPGFYLYEHRRGVEPAGERIVRRVAGLCPINRSHRIEGWPAQEGVVHADTTRARMDRGDGLPLVLLRDHTDHKLTTETPTGLAFGVRVRAQRAALDALVEVFLERDAGAQGA